VISPSPRPPGFVYCFANGDFRDFGPVRPVANSTATGCILVGRSSVDGAEDGRRIRQPDTERRCAEGSIPGPAGKLMRPSVSTGTRASFETATAGRGAAEAGPGLGDRDARSDQPSAVVVHSRSCPSSFGFMRQARHWIGSGRPQQVPGQFDQPALAAWKWLEVSHHILRML
jgi:hypothetical protein